ncbi:UNKNOWN [Stylonychia lemnae]|uniref:CID domain-containing protein n=1 Tax=Stylonychia lemnae TaxID=5949 RepID=A0A078A2H0_STYLE|nr:UNKNOWN [Stylonychia lemnae]|eukprot:CDW76012.1 UNKNOWN [Stylonychia lemnae]
MLTGSKECIISTSSHFLKLAEKNHAMIPKLMELWQSKLKECPEKKKLSFIYLANEIINISKMNDSKKNEKIQEMKSFWMFFEDIISEAVSQAYIECKSLSSDRKGMMKVVNIWKNRCTFQIEKLDQLIQNLNEIEQDLMKLKEKQNQQHLSSGGNQKQKSNKKRKHPPISLSEFNNQPDFIVQEQWLSLADLIQYQIETKAKMTKYSGELDTMCEKLDLVDEIEFDCKSDEYSRLWRLYEEQQRALLTQLRDQFAKIDNQQFQSLLITQKMDEMLEKVKKIKFKLNIEE